MAALPLAEGDEFLVVDSGSNRRDAGDCNPGMALECFGLRDRSITAGL